MVIDVSDFCIIQVKRVCQIFSINKVMEYEVPVNDIVPRLHHFFQLFSLQIPPDAARRCGKLLLILPPPRFFMTLIPISLSSHKWALLKWLGQIPRTARDTNRGEQYNLWEESFNRAQKCILRHVSRHSYSPMTSPNLICDCSSDRWEEIFNKKW